MRRPGGGDRVTDHGPSGGGPTSAAVLEVGESASSTKPIDPVAGIDKPGASSRNRSGRNCSPSGGQPVAGGHEVVDDRVPAAARVPSQGLGLPEEQGTLEAEGPPGAAEGVSEGVPGRAEEEEVGIAGGSPAMAKGPG